MVQQDDIGLGLFRQLQAIERISGLYYGIEVGSIRITFAPPRPIFAISATSN